MNRHERRKRKALRLDGGEFRISDRPHIHFDCSKFTLDTLDLHRFMKVKLVWDALLHLYCWFETIPYQDVRGHEVSMDQCIRGAMVGLQAASEWTMNREPGEVLDYAKTPTLHSVWLLHDLVMSGIQFHENFKVDRVLHGAFGAMLEQVGMKEDKRVEFADAIMGDLVSRGLVEDLGDGWYKYTYPGSWTNDEKDLHTFGEKVSVH